MPLDNVRQLHNATKKEMEEKKKMHNSQIKWNSSTKPHDAVVRCYKGHRHNETDAAAPHVCTVPPYRTPFKAAVHLSQVHTHTLFKYTLLYFLQKFQDSPRINLILRFRPLQGGQRALPETSSAKPAKCIHVRLLQTLAVHEILCIDQKIKREEG